MKSSLLAGCGVGLRPQHYPDILEKWPAMDWFEAVSENYMDSGGRPVRVLEQAREHYPIALHGVSLSIGSSDPLNPVYLERLKTLVERIEPAIVSDHLCWSGVSGRMLHDLLPLPFTEEAIAHIVSRVEQVQEFLGRKILLENVSSYVTYRHSAMPEWEFFSEVARRSGCGILLDLNNVFVNAKNHQFDPLNYIRNIPQKFVGQFHLAGHTDMGKFLFDTHSAPVIDPVWDLYQEALKLFGSVPALIEWDEDIPSFERLAAEAERARGMMSKEMKNFHPVSVEETRRVASLSDETSPSLSQVQQWMKSKIQTDNSSPDLENCLNPQGGEEGIKRISVYANGYFIRIQEALAEVYPSVRHVLGAHHFHDLVSKYTEKYPSEEYNLTYTGKHLTEFIPQWAGAGEWPFLQDLARLEWLVSEAFHAYEKPPLLFSEFSKIPLEDWEQAKFYFQPSVSVIHSDWPVLDIWESRKKPVEEVKIDLSGKSQAILIRRSGMEVAGELLQKPQFSMLEQLLAGETLGSACEKLAETIEEPLPLANWFSDWVSKGMITGCKILECS